MKKVIFFLTLAVIFIACRKTTIDNNGNRTLTCNYNNAAYIPYISRIPSTMPDTNYQASICGIIPLNKNNYWVYRDSLFNANGIFQEEKLDTLYISNVKKSTIDTSKWWVFNSTRYKGVEKYMYNTDSISYFGNYAWGSTFTQKWFAIPRTDSATFGFLHTDVSAYDKTKKINSPISIPAGTFNNYFISYKPYLHIETLEVYFVPNIGIIKFNWYRGIPVSSVMQKSELISYSIH